ncbi:hypothetical protein [Chitinophaga sp. RAB17]|uniref:hypothetical protein n=1 Tax=Chitinophaga sp. RAB17 TaxID=3233049 RepID=UPI003F91277E
MRSWITKISLVLAVMVITAHNLVYHNHDHHHFAIRHSSDHDEDEDHDNDHGKHGLFAINLIDHCFTSQSSNDLQHTLSLLTLPPVPEPVCLPEVTCYPILRTSYQLKHEFPPPLKARSSMSFRGPPTLSA